MSLMQFLCDTLFLDEREILKFSLSSPHRYKVYKIDKRNSKGKRTIAHPSRELKFIQRIIVNYLEDKLPVHGSAYAYKNGLSIKDNAEVHLKTKYLLKMDFKDFFPSITPQLFFSFTAKIRLEFNEVDKLLLERFLFFKLRKNSQLRLSIGAPSSPLISNSIMYFFDDEIKSICAEKDINYTRYADDLTFSSNKEKVLFDVPNIVVNVRNKNSLGKIAVNKSKTIFTSKAHNRHVTGITLTNDDSLSIGRNRKRLISSMIYRFTKDELEIKDIEKLQGLFSFANYIEPDFQVKMKRKYGEDVIEGLVKFPSYKLNKL